jgi:ATP-dependent DNA ligase
MIVAGKDLMQQPLEARRDLLRRLVLSSLADPIRESPVLEASVPGLIASVKAQGLEGLVPKRRDSRYEPGQRTGAWQKMRINRGQEFVIAGYTVGPRNFDGLIPSYVDDKLIYVARTRNGFTPASRDALFRRFKSLETAHSPFATCRRPTARDGARGSLRRRWLSVGRLNPSS